jgi:DNA polymerase III delta subunit
MPLIFIHGEHVLNSRAYLNQLIDHARKREVELVRFSPEDISLTAILQAFESSSLFGSERLVIIDSVHHAKSKVAKDAVLKYLQELDPQSHQAIVWEGKSITSVSKKLPNFSTKEFKSSSIIFKFLDSLTPHNRHCLSLLNDCSAVDSPEFVHYMLARHLRQLLLADANQLTGADWLKRKLTDQAQKLGQSTLFKLHQALQEIDVRNKSGKIPLNLQFELERLLISTLPLY